MWVLINRLHISDRSGDNSWKALKEHLNRKMYPVERSKALVEVRTQSKVRNLEHQLTVYNQKYHTDFFI